MLCLSLHVYSLLATHLHTYTTHTTHLHNTHNTPTQASLPTTAHLLTLPHIGAALAQHVCTTASSGSTQDDLHTIAIRWCAAKALPYACSNVTTLQQVSMAARTAAVNAALVNGSQRSTVNGQTNASNDQQHNAGQHVDQGSHAHQGRHANQAAWCMVIGQCWRAMAMCVDVCGKKQLARMDAAAWEDVERWSRSATVVGGVAGYAHARGCDALSVERLQVCTHPVGGGDCLLGVVVYCWMLLCIVGCCCVLLALQIMAHTHLCLTQIQKRMTLPPPTKIHIHTQALLPILQHNLASPSATLSTATLDLLCAFPQPPLPHTDDQPPQHSQQALPQHRASSSQKRERVLQHGSGQHGSEQTTANTTTVLTTLRAVAHAQRTLERGRGAALALGRIQHALEYGLVPVWMLDAVVLGLLGVLHIR